MANEITIPALPCHSINDILEFYGALGFEITYQQSRPNNYACVRFGDIDLHFFSMRDYDPAQSIPRITPLRNKTEGGRGFNIIDPGGNWIRISQKSGASGEDAPQKAGTSRLVKALYAAELLADSKGDAPAAAKLLDAALAKAKSAPVVERLPALVERAALAITLDDSQYARTILTEIEQLQLSDADRAVLNENLQRADDLRTLLS